MKITVLNGSPKGDLSVTMQYMNYIEKKFPKHNFTRFNVTSTIKKIEKDDKAFSEIIDSIKKSDGVVWAFPLYFLMVHAGYKRFIELISLKGVESAFKDKYATTVTTSINFFDHTAHNYMRAVSEDLGMRYVGGYSAEMHDLTEEDERKRLLSFADGFFNAIGNELKPPKRFAKIERNTFKYKAGKPSVKIDQDGRRIVVITDSTKEDANLNRMIERFRGSFKTPPELVNLNDVDIKGGCLGCIRCGYDNTCSYEGKDGYIDFYNDKVKGADILVFAGSIVDRYLSSRWKLFFDRSFFNTHIPTYIDKQVGFIVSGPLYQVPNLTEILEGYLDCQRGSVVDFVTDGCGDSREIDANLDSLAGQLVEFAKAGYVKPRTFLAVGGSKIFRDDVWGKMKFPFVADYKYYKEHGIFDFPQKKDRKVRTLNKFLTLFSKIPSVRKEIYHNMIKEKMVEPMKKAVETN